MRVIKEGTPPGEKVVRGGCGACGCIVECQVKETKLCGDRMRGGGWRYVYCPTVGCHSYIRFI